MFWSVSCVCILMLYLTHIENYAKADVGSMGQSASPDGNWSESFVVRPLSGRFTATRVYLWSSSYLCYL